MFKHLTALRGFARVKSAMIPVRRMAYETNRQMPMIVEPFTAQYKPIIISLCCMSVMYYLIFCGSEVDLLDTQPGKDNYSREYARFLKQVEEDDPELAALIKQKVGDSTYEAYRNKNKVNSAVISSSPVVETKKS